MTFEFKLPDIGEGVVEGEIVAWHLAEGEFVAEDDPLVEVMTDKATVTIPCPKAGRVVKRHFAEGDCAPVGQVIVTIDTAAAASVAAAASTAAEASAATDTPAPPARAQAPLAAPNAPAPEIAREPALPPQNASDRRAAAAPATRKLAQELGVDVNAVEGTGKGGRVTRQDVESFAASGSDSAPASETSSPVAVALTSATTAAASIGTAALGFAPSDGEVRVPIRGLRKRIYDKMAQSAHTAAHFTYVEEVDLTALVELRNRLAGKAAARGIRLTYLPFFMKATAVALRDFPSINATVDDERLELVQRAQCNISVAVATESGLTVPVIANVGGKTLFELSAELTQKAERARLGKLSREDFSGGTFTITSLGALGGILATPVLNYPEVGILGIHKIEERPVVLDGAIVIRQRMYLSSSFDHRVIDGHVGAAFVGRVKELLEDTDALLLELR